MSGTIITDTTEVAVVNARIKFLNTAILKNLQTTPLHNIEIRKKLTEYKLVELYEKSSMCRAQFER